MQRQLLQISDRVPDDILLTLLKCFAQILSREPEESSKSCGPFIRAFAKIRDDEKPFQSIMEEDEDQLKDSHNGNDNECTFSYKVGNVVTQEVVYSIGQDGIDKREEDEENGVISYQNGYENGHCSNHDDHEMPPLLDPQEEAKKIDEEAELIEEKFNEISKESEENGTDSGIDADNSQLNNENNEINEKSSIEELVPENPPQVDSIANSNTDDSEKPQIDENVEPEKNEKEEMQQQQIEERPVMPMQTVTLDDIQREIHEMQMFLFNKGIAPEITHKRSHHHHHKKLKKIEDSYNVDFCVNLKKKGSGDKKSSKSKAILTNYLNDDKHKVKERAPIFDPSVPNTPEDFLKEKSVSEKINKKKQKIKHLDVSWQKLCDSQKKVYKHSNFKPLKSEKEINEHTIE